MLRSDLDSTAYADATTGARLQIDYNKLVKNVAFDQDGKRLVINPRPGARIMDAATGLPIATLKGPADGMGALAFSPDGARLVTAYDNGGAALWGVAPTTQALVDAVKETIPRCLSPQQRKAFFLEPEPPRWCITGPGYEKSAMSDWNGKWPYHTKAWKDWLMAADVARSTGEKIPSVPK